MRFSDAIDRYVADMRADGRMNSDGTESAYRKLLMIHAEEVGNRDPAYTNRDDVKRTLRRFTHPNTQANRRAILVSFYDWCMEEGHRPDNPARQTKRPRKRQTHVYRLTMEEASAMLEAAQGSRERRVIYLGICAGLRNQEIRNMRGRHFDRPGYVWVSADIGKGGRERWIPVIPDLEPVIAEIQERCEPDEFVIPAQQFWNLDPSRPPEDKPDTPASGQAVWRLVRRVGARAGIAADIHPHLLRHAYADHVARYTGSIKTAQKLLGHATVDTTETYVGEPTLDELTRAVEGFSYGTRHTNRRSRGRGSRPQSQQYRHGDSNPGS